MKLIAVLIATTTFALSGCATTFIGSAMVENGPQGCDIKCRSWGQELVGMVAMGEYSNACICHVPDKQVSQAEVGGALGAAPGVVMQQQRNQQMMQMQ